MSPVQWWILTEITQGVKKYKVEVYDMKATELYKPADSQTSSDTPESTRDNIDEGQGVPANIPDTISTSSSEIRSEKTSKEADEVVTQSENIGKYNKF